jgi:glycosyltransferase involved in cell wall biosynthesis
LRIALFDYHVSPTNPIGGCHRRLLEGLCREHDFTVFAAEFDNPCPERILWVRVPAIRRPLVVLFVTFFGMAPLVFWYHRVRTRRRFDLIQTVESYVALRSLTYSHFCHRAYLRTWWRDSGATGPRALLRWLDHALRSAAEPWTYRLASAVVVPSEGLASELAFEYPQVRDRIRVIPNPIDTRRMMRPSHFDAVAFRQRIGLRPHDVVLVFVALGHFERKGLPLLLTAMRRLNRPDVTLLIVGGRTDLVRHYRRTVHALQLGEQVRFVGMQADTRPYLWASDAFVFPSSYEVFSLVSFEAAAAGLPLIVSSVYGVSEFLEDGVNGLAIERTPEGITSGIERFLTFSPEARRALSSRACHDVQRYDTAAFVEAWRTVYATIEGDIGSPIP